MKKKIFIFNNGGPEGWMSAAALCKEVILAGIVVWRWVR